MQSGCQASTRSSQVPLINIKSDQDGGAALYKDQNDARSPTTKPKIRKICGHSSKNSLKKKLVKNHSKSFVGIAPPPGPNLYEQFKYILIR